MRAASRASNWPTDAGSADAVIFAADIRPNVALAKEAGIAVYRGIVVDDVMQTGAPDIYALGNAPSIAASATAWSSRPTIRRVSWRGIWPEVLGLGRSLVATNLEEVSGVSVFPAGDFMARRRQTKPSCSTMPGAALTRSW